MSIHSSSVTRTCYCKHVANADAQYQQVERWIMSFVQAQNSVMKDGEGITRIKLGDDKDVSFADVCVANLLNLDT